MKKVSISVPEEKYSFFLELLESLDFATLNSSGDTVISEEHKTLVRDRIKTATTFKDWNEVKQSFKAN